MNEAKERKGEGAVSNGLHILRQHHAERRELQLAAVEERRIARAVRAPWEQIALLDERFGLGKGAAKERARLCVQAFDQMSLSGIEHFPVGREILAADLEFAKRESRACRAMRRFSLLPRTPYEYEGEKYAAQFAP